MRQRQGLDAPPLRTHQAPEDFEAIQALRFEPDDGRECRGGLLLPVLPDEQIAEVAMGGGEFGSNAQRGPEFALCADGIAHTGQGIGQIDAKQRVAGLCTQGESDASARLGRISLQVGNDPGQVQGVGVLRAEAQDLVITLGGSVELPLLMQGKRLPKEQVQVGPRGGTGLVRRVMQGFGGTRHSAILQFRHPTAH